MAQSKNAPFCIENTILMRNAEFLPPPPLWGADDVFNGLNSAIINERPPPGFAVLLLKFLQNFKRRVITLIGSIVPSKNYSVIFKRRVAPLNCFGQASASLSGFSTQNRVFDEDFNANENEDNAAGKFGVRFVFAAEDIANL